MALINRKPGNPVEELTVYSSQQIEKERLGSENDGGYVIIKNLNYDCFISCGLGDNTDFETAFLLKNPKLSAHTYLFDGTIGAPPTPTLNPYFQKRNLALDETETTTNLKYLLLKFKHIFLKMDVEGFEWDWFNSLETDQLKNIKQMAIEFHQVPKLENLNVLKKINVTHTLVHVHANNVNQSFTYTHGVMLPSLLELTFIRKTEGFQFTKNTSKLPSLWDRPNITYEPEISLNHYPFVWPKLGLWLSPK